MNQIAKLAATTVIKNNKPESTNMQHQPSTNSISNNLLSPFTWSNLNIKLPKLNKQLPNYTTIQQKGKKKKSKSKQKQKSYLKQKARLKQMYFTIDGQKFIKKGNQNQQVHQIQQIKYRYRKQSVQAIFKSTNLDMPDRLTPANPERVTQYKRQLISRHFEKSIQRNQSPKQRQIINKTSLNFTRLRSPNLSNYKQNSLCTPLTFSYNKIQTYIYRGLSKNNWCEVSAKDNGIIIPQLVWTDNYNEYIRLKKHQINNHLKNAHLLTAKHNLHEFESASGSQYYPQSYLMPFQYQNFCQQYQQQIVKICLKDIIKNCYSKINSYKKIQRHLGRYLQQIKLKTNLNQDTIMIIRLCLYLQNYRKIKNYRYFQHSQQYILVETRLQSSVLSILLKACYQYWQNLIKNQNNPTSNPTNSNFFKTQNIDEQALQVLWGYHCMLNKCQPNYPILTNRNIWIVKPIASSKGAGISLLKNSFQFFTLNYDKFQLSNKNKYANKIIQKYVEQPLLLKKSKQFTDRKFDIRQWVLVTCDSQSLQPLIYVYQNAYCRFSDMKFTYNHYRSQQTKVHLTNYSISNKTNPQYSVLLLSDIFLHKLPNLKTKYQQQINKIVVQTIMNSKDIVFQPNRFQLLGYDVIFDINQKLWLLEINQNPACQASRYAQLQKQADKMVGDMMKIVKAVSGKIGIDQKTRKGLGWKLAYGQQKFHEVDLEDVVIQNKIKPFYQMSLGQESLVQEVRRRNFMMNTLTKITNKLIFQQIWPKILSYESTKIVKQVANQQNKTIIQQSQQSIISPHQDLQNKQVL